MLGTGGGLGSAGRQVLAGLKRLVFGEAPARVLAERVQGAIAREQEDSEILVGWFQISGVTFFAILYAVSRKTFPEDAVIEPVPWTLGFYFVFTLVRLGLAYRRRLPEWFVALSVIVDMAVLLLTIWSFHIQYEQPAGFSLKAPTLLYIFILIALRALRFDARYVVLAGAAAAAGWLMLLFNALVLDRGGSMVTRDYVHYITSTDILVGGELDKVISITMVTVVLAAVLVRARRLLFRSLAEHEVAADLSRFFAPEIAREITASDQRIMPGKGEIRDAAVLYVDVRGFTVLARRSAADDVMALLAEYQARMVPVIHRHGGSIDKFLGDGIMATFGAALRTGTYAADAVRAVEELVAVTDAWSRERAADGKEALKIGFAVAAGPIVFGAVGEDTRLEYTVIGNAVNLAAKLEKHTKVEGVRALATPEVLALARKQGYAGRSHERRAARRVEGLAESIDVIVLA
ncbi:MAG: adenylate/guanylate cyclase domain-containing protein [Alphaproteobacteria bacterium]